MKYTLHGARSCSATTLLVGCLSALPAWSAQFEHGVYYRAELSDNVNQSTDEAEDELTNVLGYDLLYNERTSRTHAFLDANLEALHHAEGTQDDRIFGSADMSYRYSAIPQRLDWVVEDYMRSDRIDAFGRANADNRQVRNSLRLGPDFTARLSPQDTLELGGRYINEYEDRTEFDSNRLTGNAQLLHRLTARSSIAGNYDVLYVDYSDDDVNTDFEQHELAATYRSEFARGTYGLSLGGSYVSRDDGVTSNGVLVAANATWQANSRSTYSVAYEQNFSDRARDDLGMDAPLVTARSNVFYDRRLNVAYDYRSTFSELRLRVYAREQDFENVAIPDENSLGAVVNFRTEIAPVTDLLLMARYDQSDFSITGRSDDEYVVSAAVERQVTRRLSLSGELRRNQRDSNNPQQEYEENRIGFRVDYRL